MALVGKMAIGMVCACAASLAWARTGTVTAEKTDETFNLTFANHANETNGLWAVYGAVDRGEGTAGWDHAEFLGTVMPETNGWTYAVPEGWGESVKAIRFVLSEVPYDYDYTLDYVESDKVPDDNKASIAQCIIIDDFTMKGTYGTYTKFAFSDIPANHNQTIFSTRGAAANSPCVTVFWMSSKTFRYDYADKNASTKNKYDVADVIHEITTDTSRMLVDGVESVSRPGTAFSGETIGKIVLLNAKPNAVSSPACIKLYAFKVCDGEGDLLLDLIPMVKEGKPGMFDRVNSKPYFSSSAYKSFSALSAGPRVESENPYFASALCKVQEEGPTVFAPATPTTDDADHNNPEGGKLQSGVLTLTGNNNWGGQFTVTEGILKAGFGQGLGSNDNLLLNGGGYGGWDGVVTNRLGTGAGEIAVASGKYLVFGSVDESGLVVNVGGAEPPEPIVFNSDFRRLSLNSSGAQGPVTVKNPFTLADNNTSIFRMRENLSRIEGSLVGGTGAQGATVALYGDSIGADACCTLAGTANVFKTLQVFGGRYVFGTGSSTTLGGNFYVYAGELTLSNATVQVNNDAGMASEIRVYKNENYKGGALKIIGGEVTAGSMVIGETTATVEKDYEGPATVTLAGKLTLDPNISEATHGSATIWGSAASGALYIQDGADVNMQNLNFYRRNVFHRGGSLRLNGMYGVYNMGREGTSRYTLSGGTLYAHGVIQSTTTATVDSPTALFVFDGGRLVNSGSDAVYFTDFEPSRSKITVTANGGTFETAHNTSITNELGKGSGSWNYTTKDYLTAPAFKKSGAATLTLTEPSTYVCATDVAEGTLKLADGATLLSTTVVRVTGGTLDLGGNAQEVTALLGTAGEVKNGSVKATEGIYPGGVGAVGSFTCGAALEGTLFVDVDASGAADLVVTTEEQDLSKIDLVINAPATAPDVPHRLKVVLGPCTGEFKSVTGLPEGWTVHCMDGRVTVGPERGMAVILR